MKVKQLLVFVGFLFCLLIAPNFSVSAPADNDSIGKVIALEGKATAVNIMGKVRVLALNSSVFVNDKIQTDTASKMQIMFEDDSLVSQGEKSTLTLNEYVYNPEKKRENKSSMSLLRGVFRVLTGKITDLNPKKFEVKTKMATIGIRGCELGFRIFPAKEDIYILELPAGKTIVIEETKEKTGVFGWLGRRRVHNIVEEDILLFIKDGQVDNQRTASPSEVNNLLIDSTPGPKAPRIQTDPTALIRATPTPVTPGGPEPIVDPVRDPGQAGLPEGNPPEERDFPIAGQPVFDGGIGEDTGPLALVPNPQLGMVPLKRPPKTPENILVPIDPIPHGPQPVFTEMGGGVDSEWRWGIWELEGQLQSVDVQSPDVLRPEEFQIIVDNSIPVNLMGTGESAAIVWHDGRSTLLTGQCFIAVRANISTTPEWDGSFDLNNSFGDSLNFTAFGLIDNAGHLTGNETSYTLNIGGQGFDSSMVFIDGHPQVRGDLVGSPGGFLPITGVIGQYIFNHIDGPSVNGVFGADLLP